MKKRFLILISIICLIPNIVSADFGMPEISSYNAVVTNENGADVYNENNKVVGHLNKGDKLTISYEYSFNGKEYGYYYNDSDEDDYGYVLIDDITAVELDDSDNNAFILDEENQYKLHIFNNNVYLYTGPAFGFKKVSDKNIPVGEDLTVTKTDGDLWHYVKSSIGSGWIYYVNGAAVNEFNDGIYNINASNIGTAKICNMSIMFTENITTLYAEPNSSSAKIDVLIPKNSEYTTKYVYELIHGDWYYINYKGYSGWLEENSNIVYKTNADIFITSSKVTLYKEYNVLNSRVSVNVEKNCIYEADYANVLSSDEYGIFRIKVDGNYYWVSTEDDNIFAASEKGTGKTLTDLKYYDGIKEDSKELGTIAKDTSFKYLYFMLGQDEFVYAYDYGWITDTINLELREDEDVLNTEDDTKEKTKEETYKKSTLSLKAIILICLCGAVALSLMVIIIIMLVNKKKNKKINNEVSIVDIIEENKKEIDLEKKK